MGIDVKFSRITKKINSTKNTGLNEFTAVCDLKDNCNILNPVLLLNYKNPTINNYAYIPYLNRHYWITNWTWNNGLWEATCSVDVLGTYRNRIGIKSFYVLRTSCVEKSDIQDNYYPLIVSPTTDTIVRQNIWVDSVKTGTFALGIIGQDGLANYYCFTYNQFKKLTETIFGTFNWTGMQDIGQEISEQLSKAFFNPFQYVVSCNWYPFTLPNDGTQTFVRIGWWLIQDVNCGLLADNGQYTLNFTMSVKQHPQADTYGNYVNCSPYRDITIFVPPFGFMSLNPSTILDRETVNVEVVVDCITGVGTCYVTGAAGETGGSYALATSTAKVGVPISVNNIQTDIVGAVEGAAKTALSFSGGAVSGAVGAVAGFADTASSIIGDVRTGGQNGGFSQFLKPPYIYEKYYSVGERDIEHLGVAYGKNAKPSELGSGYYLVADGEMDILATQSELQELKDRLESGFFYE